MSQFLPERFGQSSPGQVTEFSPGTQQTTQEDVALMQRVFGAAAANPLLIPPDLMAYFLDYIQTSRLIIPIGQIFGFSQFTANVATPIATSESTTASTYGDLATVGPSLSGLPNGQFVVLFGSTAAGSTATNALMSIEVNGVTALDADGCRVVNGSAISISRAVTKSLSAGSNTITAKYRSSDGSTGCSFDTRWLIALKYAN